MRHRFYMILQITVIYLTTFTVAILFSFWGGWSVLLYSIFRHCDFITFKRATTIRICLQIQLYIWNFTKDWSVASSHILDFYRPMIYGIPARKKLPTFKYIITNFWPILNNWSVSNIFRWHHQATCLRFAPVSLCGSPLLPTSENKTFCWLHAVEHKKPLH